MTERNDTTLIQELALVFGEDRARQIEKQVNEIKKKNPDARFEFIVNEDGSVKVEQKEILS